MVDQNHRDGHSKLPALIMKPAMPISDSLIRLHVNIENTNNIASFTAMKVTIQQIISVENMTVLSCLAHHNRHRLSFSRY